jgi:RNA processing factor Prp31
MSDFNPNDNNAVIARIDAGIIALSAKVDNHHTEVMSRMERAEVKLERHDTAITEIDTATKTKARVLGTILAVVSTIFGAVEGYHLLKH